MVRKQKGLCLSCGRITPLGRRYCSKRCVLDAWNARRRQGRALKRETVKCGQCNTSFEPKRITARFCSSRCRVAAHRAVKRRNAKRLATKPKETRAAKQQRASQDIVFRWLDGGTGSRSVSERNPLPPGGNLSEVRAAVAALEKQGHALVETYNKGQLLKVMTAKSLRKGVEHIQRCQKKGELGDGVSINPLALGKPAVVRKANADTIRQYRRLMKRFV